MKRYELIKVIRSLEHEYGIIPLVIRDDTDVVAYYGWLIGDGRPV